MSIQTDIKQKNFRNPYHKLTVNIMFSAARKFSKCAKILKPYTISEQQYHFLKILSLRFPQTAVLKLILKGYD